MRIYRPPDGSALFANVHAHWLPFDLERDKWTYVDDIAGAEVIPVMQWRSHGDILSELQCLRDDQLLVLLMTFHMMDNQDTFQGCEDKANPFRDNAKHVSVIHTNAYNNHPDHIYYDMMWNRHKAYYTEYEQHDLANRVWSLSASKSTYHISGLAKREWAKHFLCLNRIYYNIHQDPRMRARALLADHLRDSNGWISDPQRGNIIEPEAMTTDMRYHLLSGSTTWWPAARFYYENSYISIYVESLTHSTHASLISEKTYDAFMNGHFILPFGYSGLIEDIRDRGFILPDWINYDYDQISDFDDRFSKFLEEVDRLLALPIATIHQHWQKDLPTLEKNRHWFWKKPYDELHSKIQARYNLTCR